MCEMWKQCAHGCGAMVDVYINHRQPLNVRAMLIMSRAECGGECCMSDNDVAEVGETASDERA